MKDDYEKRILLQTARLSDFYEDALSMQVLQEEALYDKIIQIVHKYLDAEKCSLYVVEDEKLILKAFAGYQEGEARPRDIIDSRVEPYQTLFSTREVISINQDIFREQTVQYMPVYMGPLKTSYNQVIGVINIDTMNFLKFNKTSKKIFAALCGWASKALENAHSYRTCVNRRIIKPETGLFTYQYLKLRIEEAMFNSLNTRASFSLLLIRILYWDRITEKNREPVIKFVSRVIQQNVRDFDILGHFEHENEFAVLMPQISQPQLEAVITNMENQLNKFRLQPYDDRSLLQLHLNGISGFGQMTKIDELVEAVRYPEKAIEHISV